LKRRHILPIWQAFIHEAHEHYLHIEEPLGRFVQAARHGGVQGHSPDQRVTVLRKRNVKIKELKPVGNYAVRIVFDDGHDTGLYAWPYLQTLDAEREKRWAEYLSALAVKGLSRG
jgi:DUF971 family protein